MTQKNTQGPRASYAGKEGAWIGVIKIGKKTIWQCGHTHCNRCHSSTINHSAEDCADGALKAALLTDEVFAELERSKNEFHIYGSAVRPNPARDNFRKEQRPVIRAAIAKATVQS